MNCDDEEVAKCGLEIARLLLDTSFRDFQIARYDNEKGLIMEGRQRRRGEGTVLLGFRQGETERDVG